MVVLGSSMEAVMKRAVSVALLLALVAGADEKKSDAKKDKDLLKGTWVISSMERGGKPNEKSIGDKVTFDGDSLIVQGKDEEHKGTYKLDATKKPKQIDVTPGDGPEKDKVLRGIYSLEKDELKICIAHDEQERPTAFESKEGSEVSLVTLKRDK
jgi:uncharacterized protein (TIGR03067 family)